jgi:hypothetical protein
MAIDKKELKRYIEELGLPEPLQAELLQNLEADPTRAGNFVGQRLRLDDYTRKTMELADQRKQAEAAVGQAVQEYATKLQEAEGKMAKILRDLESERISRATAEQRLQRVKSQYELSDDDIPAVEAPGVRQPRPELDLDQKLAEFKTSISKEIRDNFVKEIMPELMSFPQISAIQQDIAREHYTLTGKHLTSKDFAELTKLAGEEKTSLYNAWERKHDIAGIRMTKHDEELTTRERQKWEDEQKRKNSEAALAGVNRATQDGKSLSTSPVFRPYEDRSKDLPGFDGKPNGSNGEAKPMLSGAERASVKWMERRNQGVPLGKEAPAK